MGISNAAQNNWSPPSKVNIEWATVIKKTSKNKLLPYQYIPFTHEALSLWSNASRLGLIKVTHWTWSGGRWGNKIYLSPNTKGYFTSDFSWSCIISHTGSTLVALYLAFLSVCHLSVCFLSFICDQSLKQPYKGSNHIMLELWPPLKLLCYLNFLFKIVKVLKQQLL